MPAVDDPESAAAAAGLRYVDGEEPGITRHRHGRGFTYRTPTGRTLRSKRHRARIDALAIPPAWTDVWICADTAGHIQASGRDDRGRKQYRYHDRWEQVRAADKFGRLAAFGGELTDIRRRVAEDLDRDGLGEQRVLALVVRLLDETLVRIGNPEYARNESYGLTTLQARHVETDGDTLQFEFEGKSGVDVQTTVQDASLVEAVRACDDLGGTQLFTYRDGDRIRNVLSDDVNDYLHAIAGPQVTARDFRTWGGTVAAVGHLGAEDVPATGADSVFLDAVDHAAERLGNTRAVCRAWYIHPAVHEAFVSGGLQEAWRRSRRTRRLTRAERTTLRLLGS